MKTILLILISVFILSNISLTAQCPEKFHDFNAINIKGTEVSMSDFVGKKVLVVNTASFCGYTSQYSTLQQLYDTYGGDENPYNFEIIGFPANNFGNQEPYDEEYIEGVCDSYNVSFTMMSKVSVTGTDQHEIYKWLTKLDRNCVQNASVTWNFQKFLINPDGSWHATKTPATSPLHTSIVSWITDLSDIEQYDNNLNNISIYFNQLHKNLVLEFSDIKTQNLRASIYSITGQSLKEFNLSNYSKNYFEFNLSDLSQGTYIVEIRGENLRHNSKIMVY